MALTGFGPGHCDRAVKYLLYTTWYSEHKPAKELRENYKREIQTLRATGITRDGWCYIVMYAAVGKVMMDFIVVVMSRLLVAGLEQFLHFAGCVSTQMHTNARKQPGLLL